jgi:hypothetical protein
MPLIVTVMQSPDPAGPWSAAEVDKL